jgi:hypothetical protein
LDFPIWVLSPRGFAIGTRRRLREDAHVVQPRHCGYPTLALGADPRSDDR